jgi:hypothetical protein
MFDTLLGGLFGRRPASKAHAPKSFKPQVEKLEERAVPAAIRDLTGFRANIMLPNIFPPFTGFNNTSIIQGGYTNDGTSGPVNLGFNINFFGNVTNTIWVNNNGNLTLNGTTTATPGLLNLPASGIPMIAPFFADATTLFYPDEPVTYGVDFIGGHLAFGVDYINVTYNPLFTAPTLLNQFQVILIDRSDTGPGNFDIEFNYNQIRWEAGETDGSIGGIGPRSAIVGFSDGTGQLGHYYLQPGSGAPGSFLDGGPLALRTHSLFAATAGRYHFLFRNGVPVFGLPAAGADLTPFIRELDPFRYVFNRRDQTFSGKFSFERFRKAAFAPFIDDLALDEINLLPLNSIGPPITIVYTHLPPGATPLDVSGFTASGLPFLTLPDETLATLHSHFRLLLHFRNPRHVPMSTFYRSFMFEVFAGPFNPALE